MKRFFYVFCICLLVFPVCVMVFSRDGKIPQKDLERAGEYFRSAAALEKPKAKEGGGKYVIAYVDIDPYPASGEMLYYLIEELRRTGWISYEGDLPFSPENTDAGKLIDYLADRDLGDYIAFSREANYYTAIEDRDACMESLQAQLDAEKIDLIFCMGTDPGKMVIEQMHVTDVPVMLYFSVDPVGSGFSETDAYSGQENVWCHTSFDVYRNQMQFYYNNIPFENIGMVYYDAAVAAERAYRSAAEEIGFQISERIIEKLTDGDNKKRVNAYYKKLKRVFTELVEKEHIDAFLLNTDVIKDEEKIPELLEIFYQKKIPVFVQNSEFYVKDGALMLVAASDAKQQAPFVVEAMASILGGKSPGSVYQKFVPSPYLTLNLKTARRLGFNVKEELLLSAEKLYE